MTVDIAKIWGLWFPAPSPTALPTWSWPRSAWARSTSHLVPPTAKRLSVDRDLICRCRAGDPDAFDCLFEQTKDHIYTLALHFSGDETTAADVTQEVFLKLLERVGQFRQDAEFSTWLYRVVLNTFLDQRRGLKPWIAIDDSALLDSPPAELTFDATQAEDAARHRSARQVRHAVAELKPRHRALIVLRYGAGLSYEEIAAVLEISAGTVASRLSRAHARLAKKLRHLQDYSLP